MRFNPDRDRYNAWGQDTWTDPDEEQHWRDMRPGQDEVPVLLRCSLCGKDLRARELCSTCGDETDVERDGQRDSRPYPVTCLRHKSATPARLAERPDRNAA